MYSLVYWSGANAGSGTSSEQLGAAVATAMVMPHLVLVALSVVFNALATFLKKSAFALTAGILYALHPVLLLRYCRNDSVLCWLLSAQESASIEEEDYRSSIENGAQSESALGTVAFAGMRPFYSSHTRNSK